MDFNYGLTNQERRRGNFPELPLINMIAESMPVEGNPSLQSRPGLKAHSSGTSMGSSAVKELYQVDGVLGGSLFGVSGTTLYEGATSIGTINGTGNVSFAGYEDYVFVNAGTDIWSYDGVTLASIAFPDSAAVSKIVVGASRLIALRAGTGTFYWTDALGVTVDALDFATAENGPDTILDMLYIGDRLMLFGSETVEFWPATADDNLPFQPLIGATFTVGIKALGCATEFDKGFAWVTNENEVCVNDPRNVISGPELQTLIGESTNIHTWRFWIDGAEFLALTLDDQTWAYSARTGSWSKFESYNQTNWICQCYENGYFGTTTNGDLLEFGDHTVHYDLTDQVERSFRGWIPTDEAPIWLANVVLRMNPGNTSYLTGTDSDPSVELRTSQDGGRTWQPWQSVSMGTQGQYRLKTIWSSLGQFGYPGVMVEVRCSADAPFRISGLKANEPFGGI